ncbi:MAG: hypothetical protein ABF823_09720, partial [Acetobacter syzygii]
WGGGGLAPGGGGGGGGSGGWGGWGGYGGGWGGGFGTAYTYSCQTNFELVNDVVKSWTMRGDGC